MSSNPAERLGLWAEIRLIARRAFQVWCLVSRRHRIALACAAVLIFVTSFASSLIPMLLGALVDAVQRGSAAGLFERDLLPIVGYYLGLLGAVYLAREAIHVGRRYLVESTCTRVEADVTVGLVDHLLKADLSRFSRNKVGALHGRILRSVDGFVRFLRLGFLELIPALTTGVIALVLTLAKQPRLAFIMACVIPVSLTLTIWQLLSQKGVRLEMLRCREDMDGTVVEQLGGLDFIRVSATHALEVERVARSAEERRRREVRHHFVMSLFGCGKALNEGFFHLVVLAVAIYLAIFDIVSYGDVLTFSLLFMNVMTPLAEVHKVIDEGHEASLRVGDLLDLRAERPDPSYATPAGRPPVAETGLPLIEMEGVCVEYHTPEGLRKPALLGVDLTIRHGETIGVAGRSGGGKSTWLQVLLRLTQPSAGKVLLGGVPLEEVARADLAELVGYVGQTPFVFAGTIEENIAYGMKDVRREDIERAARMACLEEEILAMPEGYETRVAERGRNLSGGQRQRLALARLFLKNPRILILDEATSALDTISERAVQRSLELRRTDRTVILVAHRLTTLLDADRILVFDRGQIVESGTFAELASRGSTFADLLKHANEGTTSNGHHNGTPPVVSVPAPRPDSQPQPVAAGA